MGMSLTYLFLLTFSALFYHTKSGEDVRPCNRLPDNPTPEELAEADFYCQSVFSRYLTDPIGENGQRCPEAKNPGCTLVRTFPGGLKYRCTVEVKNSKFKTCVVGHRYSRVPMSACATTFHLWIRPVGLHNQSMRTSSEVLEATYLNDENENDPKKQKWEKLTNNVAVYAIQGKRPKMEDRFVFTESVKDIGVSIFAVFDGHGGEFAADYAQDHLLLNMVDRMAFLQKHASRMQKRIANNQKPSPPNEKEVGAGALTKDGRIDYEKLLHYTLLSTDEDLCATGEKTEDGSGSTALVALIEGSRLYVANVGDSRGVMCDHQGNPIPLSVDHKPNLARERARIKKAGGTTELCGTVWRVCGCFALSRSLGDCAYKKDSVIIADPDVLTFDLSHHKPQFLVLASDGLFDALSNLEVITFIKQRIHEDYFGAKSLAHYAFFRGSRDNITILVVNFKNYNWASDSKSEGSGNTKISTAVANHPPKLEAPDSPAWLSKGTSCFSARHFWYFNRSDC